MIIDVQERAKKVVKKRVFVKETSVFKDWKEDSDYSLMQAFESDTKYWKVNRLIKDSEDVTL
jgi:hypothetical protein